MTLIRVCRAPRSASSNTAPAWFLAMPEKTWSTPVTNTLRSVVATTPTQGGEPDDITNAWTGGAVDQGTGNIVLGPNGGHAAYSGNEIYACNIRANSPAWRLCFNPSVPTGGDAALNGAGNYTDGGPRSCHNYHYSAALNGTQWAVGLPAMEGTEEWSIALFSAAYATNTPWVAHGIPAGFVPSATPAHNEWLWQGGPCALDETTGLIWASPAFAITTPFNGAIAIDAMVVPPTYTIYDVTCNFGLAWSAIIPEEHVWIIGAQNSILWLLDLTNPAAGFVQLAQSGTGRWATNGAVYHAPSRAILTWYDDGATIVKLTVPADVRNGTYVWSTVSAAGSNAITPTDDLSLNGVYGRFNIVRDMGNGQGALTLFKDIDEPVYVYKLPVGVLT